MNKLSVSLSLFLSYIEYNLRRSRLWHRPLITGVEITNTCNYACEFCPINSKNKETIFCKVKRKKTLMSPEDFEKILIRYKRYMGVVDISHHGESFTHPQFSRFIEILKRHGVAYGITTNGSLIRKHFKTLIGYPPAQIFFSLYTLNKKNYSKLTGVGRLDPVLSNIEEFLKLREENGMKTTVFIRTINYPLIRKDIPELERFFSKYDVIIDRNVLNSWAGRVDLKKYDVESERHTRKDKYCIQPWQHIIICSDGGVYICNNHEDMPIGYVLKKDVMDIWNSDALISIRKNILSGRLSDNRICADCDYFNFASTVDAPSVFFFIDRAFIKKALIYAGIIKRGDLGEMNISSK